MIIAGFDQAVRRIGWCYGEPGTTPTRGLKDLPDFGDNTQRLGRYVRDWAKNFLKGIGAERAYVENIFVRKHGFNMPVFMKQARVLLTLEDAAELAGLDADLGFWVVDISDWRREEYAGSRPTKGQGSESEAWKDMALAECLRRNWLVDDHNVAEACLIWDYGCRHADTVYRTRSGVTKRRQQSAADEARRGA